MKPAERRHPRTHQVRYSSTRVLRNMQDGFCKVAAACINQARQIIFREISVYSKVAVRPRHCYTCGVIQQLLTAYIDERLHQHISTHNVATLAKALPWLNKRTIRSIAAGRHGSRSTSTYPSLPSTTYSRGRRSTTQQSAPNRTSLSRGGNRTSRQSVTTWVKWQRSSTNLYSASSYLRTGESLLVQQQWYNVTTARNQAIRGLELDRGDVRRHPFGGGSASSPVRTCYTRD